MSTARDRYLAAADKMADYVERLSAVAAPTPQQVQALITDLRGEVRNLRAAAEVDEPAAPADDGGPVGPLGALFVAPSDEPYLIGGTPAGNPNGATFSVADAIRWYTYVWSHNVGYHHVRPTLLPGSRALTQAGATFARAFQEQPGLDEAPEDFNPLGLPVVP